MNFSCFGTLSVMHVESRARSHQPGHDSPPRASIYYHHDSIKVDDYMYCVEIMVSLTSIRMKVL